MARFVAGLSRIGISDKILRSLTLKRLIGPLAATLGIVLLFQLYEDIEGGSRVDPVFRQNLPPLVMQGGDPYIRALMRTISASEANSRRPYSILYGGKHVGDLSRHPQMCITIVNGPNKGNCSTAAGRYQVINTTWYTIAPRYHPNPSRFLIWVNYGFQAEYQDAVIHAWLSDPRPWGDDISQLLREGKIRRVLRLLSPTWTSLGYGIETNSMSSKLPRIYKKMLQEELQTSQK